MALVRCPDCGRDVSSEAPACPGCGRPMKGDESPVAIALPVVSPVSQPPDGLHSPPAGRKTMSAQLIVVLICVVVPMVFCVGVCVIRPKKEPESFVPLAGTAPGTAAGWPLSVGPPPTPTRPTEMQLWEKKNLAETMLKMSLRDPDSYKSVGWTRHESRLAGVPIPAPYEVWGLTYRAKNGFGGYDVAEQVYIFGLNSVVPYLDKK